MLYLYVIMKLSQDYNPQPIQKIKLNFYQLTWLLRQSVVDSFTLVNTHNGDFHDRGTNEFKVITIYIFTKQIFLIQIFLGDNEAGPWTEVLHENLPDARGIDESVSLVPAISFQISPSSAKYIKFKVMSWFGHGGGLQYFSVHSQPGNFQRI